MNGLWGHLPQQPQELFAGVATQARRLGRRVAGDDLFLLALSGLPDDSPARRALEAERLDSARIEEQIRTGGDQEAEGEGRVTFCPSLLHDEGES